MCQEILFDLDGTLLPMDQDEFAGAKTACGFNHMAQELIDVAKDTGCKVVLATNPIFPHVATKQRIQWAGLKTA